MWASLFEYFHLPLTNPVLIFAVILFIILVAPLLFNKFRIPHLIGLILAGAIIGPHGLNLMLRDSSIVLFGTVGLLYIMFLAGIEIDLGDFQRNRFKSIVFGLYTFIIPMTIGTLVGMYILKYSVPTSILLASMFASHTLITYPIVSKMGITRNVAVSTAVGGTIITDTLALLVLAVIAAMVKGQFNSLFVLHLSISVTIFVISVMLLYPMIARWFFKNNNDSISHYIFVLALVFLAGFFAQLAGVEPIIGAFLAGISLNRFIPNASPLMNRINFVGNALFIPFFLLSVGMLINFKVFFGDIKTIQVGLIMTIVATFCKYSAAWLAQKTFGFSKDQRNVIFGLSNSQAAATLAAIIVGYNIILEYDSAGNPIRLLDENILNGTILMILVTCIISSFATQRGARNLAINSTRSQEGEPEQIAEKILIPINNIENADNLIIFSSVIKSKKNTSELFALNVVTQSADMQKSEADGKRILERASQTASASDNFISTLLRYASSTENGIINTVNEQKISDIILGLHHSSNLSENFLGKITDSILARCNANVIVYKQSQPIQTIKRTIVIIPDKAEFEIGFAFWLIRVWNLSRNLGTELAFFSTENTLNAIERIHAKYPVKATFNEFSNWSRFAQLIPFVEPDDMVFIIMSRKGHISYTSGMSRIPQVLNYYFTKNSFTLTYPLQSGHETDMVKGLSSLLDLETMKGNIERLDDVGKEIVKLFWKK
jgi:Kef-type K+ transport system membrane component KefB/nucleotide-binding universal stress UspA family protein